MPSAARRLLVVAAAEPAGDPVLVWAGGGRLGIGPDAAAAAEADGLLVTGARVMFRHPLVRSAVYRAASPPQRRAVHQALRRPPIRRPTRTGGAWHLAQAAPGLMRRSLLSWSDRPAGRRRAAGRGGGPALPGPSRRAHARPGPAGRPGAGRGECQAPGRCVRRGASTAGDRGGRATGMKGSVPGLTCCAARSRLCRDASWMLPRCCSRRPSSSSPSTRRWLVRPTWKRCPRRCSRDVLASAAGRGRWPRPARGAPPAPQPERGPDLLLDGLALLITEGYAAGVPVLKRARRAFPSGHISNVEGMRWTWFASHIAISLWDWRDLATAVRPAG